MPALRYLFVLMLLWPLWATAGNMSVFPLRVTMDAVRNSEALTVRNMADGPLLLQPTVVKWTQKDGKDVYEPTRDVLIAPALVEIPAKELQVVRLALRRAPDPTRELAYRVMLREVPKSVSGPGNQLVMALNISLPVFIAPASGEARGGFVVSSAVTQTESGRETLALTLSNSTSAHIQIKNLVLSESGSALGDYNTMFYLLPGESNTIRVPVSRRISAKSVRIDAQTDAGPQSSEFPIR